MHKCALSEQGAKDMIKAFVSVTVSNLVLMVPIALLYYMVKDYMEGNLAGKGLWYVAGIVVTFVLIAVTTYIQYNATFLATYIESGVRRITLAEKLRKIPLSFFGKKDLSDLTSTITLRYEPSVREDEFATQIVMSEQKDLFTGTTNIGPHRDDLSFVSEGIDFREYGSRGQKRTAALSLKLTEIKIVEEKKGEKPILLLDDVLSELDRNRQN